MWQDLWVVNGFVVLEKLNFDGFSSPACSSILKISPVYEHPIVHVLDASRSVPVAGSLLGEETKNDFAKKIKEEYQILAENHAKRQSTKDLISIEEAIANRWKHDGVVVKPKQLGIHTIEMPISQLLDAIDWTPFFQTWELSGRYPKIFEDNKMGAEAKKLFNDAQEMLKRLVSEKWIQANAIVGFWPANSIGDDIELYINEDRNKQLAILHTLRQQIARDPARDHAHTALSDFIAPKDTRLKDYIGAFAVTCGIGEEEALKKYINVSDDYGRIL